MSETIVRKLNFGHRLQLIILWQISLSFRLSRLLHKHKFDEAERFARQFNLNVEVKDILFHKYDKISLVTFQFLSLSLANRTVQHAKKVVPDNPGWASGICYWVREFCS